MSSLHIHEMYFCFNSQPRQLLLVSQIVCPANSHAAVVHSLSQAVSQSVYYPLKSIDVNIVEFKMQCNKKKHKINKNQVNINTSPLLSVIFVYFLMLCCLSFKIFRIIRLTIKIIANIWHDISVWRQYTLFCFIHY